jgi:hypothetical protein
MPKATKARPTTLRAPGEGTVYAVRPGYHRGEVTWTDPDGTRHRRIVSGRTAREARDRLDDLRRELRLGTLAPAGPTLTVGGSLAD